jgi:hypothetical protein
MYSLCAQFSTAAEGCDATAVDLSPNVRDYCRQPNKKSSACGRSFQIYYTTYTLKCAKALLASAIRCVSSFFLNAAPSPFAAATISLANLSAMLRPFLSRL